MKINIVLIKTFPNLPTLYLIISMNFNKFQCRISTFDAILFTPRLYKIGVFYTSGKSHALINVWIMSYLKCWNWRRILKFSLNFESLFSLSFQLKKKLQPNFAFLGEFKQLRCLNSKEIKLQSSIGVICTSFRTDFFRLKIKK